MGAAPLIKGGALGRKAEIILEYQGYIEAPPVAPQQLYAQSCSSDGATIEHWRDTWIGNIKANHKSHGPFKDKGVGLLHGKHAGLTAIIAGSGPSLKVNGADLKDRPKHMPLVSCLHNFHFLEDLGCPADYYVTLDAGEITIAEVSEGGTKTEDEYWALTKERTLIAYIGTSPKLLAKWQGKVYFFNCAVPDEVVQKEIDALEVFNTYISNGGNVLGACLYIAKGVLGCNPIAFIGADFAFGYDKKFHAWNSQYDKTLGHVVRAVDVYGNKVFTWPSYSNFKAWFDWVSVSVPGIYINCTEGGTFGAYPEGNILSVRQMELKELIQMSKGYQLIQEQCENPATGEKKILF